MMRLASVTAAFVLAFAASSASADISLFAADNLTAWVDLRAASVSGEASWLSGDYGKLQFGGAAATGSRQTQVEIATTEVVWTPRFTDALTATVEVEHLPELGHKTGVNEAYLKWKPVPTSPLRWQARLGELYPPVSLEHDGPGWTTTRTLTPSAINTWIGEEVLVRGAELNLKDTLGESDYGVTAAVFGANDTAGALLAYRGWALDDIRTPIGAKLPLPSGDTGYSWAFPHQAPYSEPTDAVDHRLGSYLKFDWRPPYPVALNLVYYSNNGDPAVLKRGQYGWGTRFVNLGLTYDFDDRTEILAQYLYGGTRMGWVHPSGYNGIDDHFSSGYVLASRRLSPDLRLSLRADYFAVENNAAQSLTDDHEVGHSVTLALMQRCDEHLSFGLEALTVQSRRPSRADVGEAADQSQTLIQLSVKARL